MHALTTVDLNVDAEFEEDFNVDPTSVNLTVVDLTGVENLNVDPTSVDDFNVGPTSVDSTGMDFNVEEDNISSDDEIHGFSLDDKEWKAESDENQRNSSGDDELVEEDNVSSDDGLEDYSSNDEAGIDSSSDEGYEIDSQLGNG